MPMVAFCAEWRCCNLRNDVAGETYSITIVAVHVSESPRPAFGHSTSIHGGPKKNGYPNLFGDNFDNSAPILTILSLLQAKINGA